MAATRRALCCVFRSAHTLRLGLLVSSLGVALLAGPAFAQNEPAIVDEEFARQQKVIDRFVTVLEKNPRRGTALDKIYGFHVETGSLDTLVKRYEDRAAKNPRDSAAWMILGLIEAERGRDAAAVAAFTKAAETSPKDALPAYYLGQSLVLVGQPEKAVEAFETAIARKPVQNDLLEIFQALGRVHQRAQRTEEALEVWSRLEKLFPNDARVQEQIAATLAEEGQAALALPRYEALVKITKDDYRKSVYRIEAAELKVRLNRSAEAIADLEKLLASLNPTSWLHREVRRKIEEVFLRTDDQDGLAKYYESWVKKNPEDVDAMARLARVLARQARVPEAQVWLDKALKLAPSRKELRAAFIEQLVDDQRYPEAIEQYALLDQADPNNPDYLREWGKLILRDLSQPKAKRLAAAEKVWRRLLAARPKDPLIATQVADLFRHSEMTEPALELYQKAVELAPDQPQYREYLGEYYHQLKRPEDALATWRQIAAGKNRSAANLARLAEVFASFGYLEQALPEIKAACQLDPKDFSLQMKAADLLIKADQHSEALAALAAAEKLTQNDEEAEAVLVEQLKVYQLDNSLVKRTAELAKAVEAGAATAEQLFLLARLHETLRQYPEATRAIEASLKLSPQSVRSLASAARIYEQSGDLKTAADLNRRLALVDRRGRSDYLKYVAQLETQLGRTDEALKAGRDLITSAPGNTENYEFYADLCFRLGKAEEGLQTLRRAIRVNPTEPKLVLALAAALTEQFRSDEAIELYWQAFEKGTSLDERINIVQKLADLHLQTNQFDRLLERVERLRRDADDKREATICLAQAYHSAGDYGMARQELESLLTDNTRDTQLLQQLSKLAETERDFTSAVKYQEQLAKLAPGPETEYRLATLLAESGAPQESAAILVRLAQREEDPEKLLRTIDSLLATEQESTALLIIESKLREDEKNWELLYREGVALVKKPEEAAPRFEAILALPLPDDTEGISEKNRREKEAKSKNAAAMSQRIRQQLSRLDYSYQVRGAVGLSSPDYGYSGPAARRWAPTMYSQARMASLGWLYRFAQDAKQQDDFLERFQKPADDDKATARQLWDWMYLASLTGAFDNSQDLGEKQRSIARRLARQKDLPGQYLYLSSLQMRSPRYRGQQGQTDSTPALAEEDLQLALDCYNDLRKWYSSAGSGNDYFIYLTTVVMEELKRAGRAEEGAALLKELVDKSQKPDELAQAIFLNASLEDTPATVALFEKWARATLQDTRKTPSPYSSQVFYALGQAMGGVGAAKKHDEVLALLDLYLDYNRARASKERQKTARRSRRTSQQAGNVYYQIWYGKQAQGVNMSFPTPSDYFDHGALVLLRNAQEVFQRNDVRSDLEQHLRQRLATAGEADKLYENLALAYFHWWCDDKEAAISDMTAASELAPQDTELRLQVARFHTELQNFDEALTLVDGIAPLDQDTLRERETMALNLAVRLGDHDRARQAAERLFGLRLDAETQIQLASQMRRLGMNQEADAVLARAQRQVGNRLNAMVSLMNSYQADGKSDIAMQIAHQILRQSRKSATAVAMYRGGNEDSFARTAALAVLGSAGKLKQMIADVEQQLERTPAATQLFDTLAEYYQAAGDREKALAWQGKMVELKQDDYELRNRYAQQLSQAGKVKESCEQYKVILRKQPRILQNRFYEVTNTFRQAQKESELVAILSEIDIRQFGQYYYVMNLVNNLISNKEQRAAAMALLKKVWEAFPESRQNMLTSFYNEEIWDDPEMFEYGKQSLIPTAAAVQQSPWVGIERITSYSSNGEVYTVLRNVLRGAAKTNQTAKLRADLAAAASERPDWKAGPLILAVIDAKEGKIEAARPVVEKALTENMPSAARWIIGQELEAHESLRDLVLRMYEGALQKGDANLSGMNQFQYSPGPRLVRMYIAAGRREEAHKLLKKAESFSVGDQYDAAYAASRKFEQTFSLAQQYQELQFPIDALRLYRQIATSNIANDPNIRQYGNVEYYQSQTQQQLDQVLAQLAKSASPEMVRELLAPHTSEPGIRDDKPVLDLMLGVQVDKTGLPRLDSQLIKLLTQHKLTAEMSRTVSEVLAELTAAHPEDLSVRVVATLVAITSDDDARSKQALTDLQQLLEATPLEELPAGQRANARQREQAMRQLPVWLVAAECLEHEKLRATGEQLATLALVAAQRQLDRNYGLAILFQRSERAIKLGDKSAAEAHLTSLLDVALARPQTKKQDGKKAEPNVQPNRSTPPRANGQPKEAAPAETRSEQIPPVTLSQFKIAVAAARLAAEHDLPVIAVKAMREALRGGLPVPDVSPVAANTGRVIRTSGIGLPQDSGESAGITQTVADELLKLSRLWRTKQLPAEEMYSVLREIVLPANRPNEILLYQRALGNWNRPESLGLELVRWSIAIDQAAALQKDLAARQATARLPAQVLTAFLAIESKDQPAAAQALAELTRLATAQPNTQTFAQASHAATLAFARRELEADAAPILEIVVKTPQQQSGMDAGGPLPLLARHYVRNRQLDKLRTLYSNYLQSRQSQYGQYGGDYGLYVQRQDLHRVVTSVAHAGNAALTLEYLGRFSDTPEVPNYGGNFSLDVPLWHFAWQVKNLPPAERYALLRDWTLPSEQRRTLRFIAGVSSGLQMPDGFLSMEQKQLGPTPEIGILSSFTLLVDAAREAGTLDELHSLAKTAEVEKLPQAATLVTLVSIARDDPDAAGKVKQATDALRLRMKTPAAANTNARSNQELESQRWSDVLVLAAALERPKTRAQARELVPLVLQDVRKASRYDRTTHVARLIALDATRDVEPASREQLLTPGLVHWSPSTPPQMTGSAMPPAWWTAHGKHIAHITGFEYDSLFFDYPLTGTFEFSFEAHSYDFSQGEVAYGGLISIPQFWARNVQIVPVSRHETVTRDVQLDARDWWNRYTVKVSPESLRFYSGGHLVYEEPDPSPTSPWLHLVSLDHRRTDFRNLQLRGQPEIPREVRLSHADRLNGWVAAFNARLPQRLVPREPSPKLKPNQRAVSNVDARPLDWWSEKGVIHGRHDPDAGDHAQARLNYHRPLQSGDTLRYEFHYEPGKTHVHPAIGRLAIMLESDGLRLHWITTGPGAADPINLESDNAIEPANSLAAPLPLKEGEWNAVEISLAGDVANVKLNSQTVLEQTLDATLDRRFGLFHFRDQSGVQVRNVVLSGDWPQELTKRDLANLVELESKDETPAMKLARHALVREEEQADEAYEVWLAAQALSPDERFAMLRQWVLPSAEHPTFRLQADFPPVDQPAPLLANNSAPSKGRRLHSGGQLVSPAIELVRTAAQLKRLDELDAALRSPMKNVPEGARNLLAMQTLIATARENDAMAGASLKMLHEQLKTLDPATPLYQRWPEVIVVQAALERPELRKQALPLAKLLVENQQNNHIGGEWERTVRWLRAKATWASDPATASLPMGHAPQKLTQWVPVSHPTAEQRGRGLPPPTWRFDKGKAEFFTGHGGDSLYFQSPLAGNFEVRARRTTFGWKEIYLQYALVGIDVHHQGTSVFRAAMARGRKESSLPAKLPNWAQQIDYRLVVKDGVYTVFLNDVQAHTERLPATPDPWLSIQTHSPHFNGSVENVQILGTPTVPDVIQLSAADNLLAWRSDYYGDSIDTPEALWTKSKDEIVGNKIEHAPGAMRESVLHYHRPLLEDGEIEYDFFYEPGKTEVHPAVDRAALLITADGVKLHYLTDGAYDRTGLGPASASPLAGASQAIPLLENDWNRISLVLKGDVVTLTLNGQKIASHTLEPTNQRLFGLFRYSDATAVRVKNVTYRGAWPKQVPPVARQELAMPAMASGTGK